MPRPRLRKVELWPDGGRRDRPWVAGAPGADAFARAGARVVPLFSAALVEHGVRLRSSLVRVLVREQPAPGPELVLTVHSEFLEGFEMASLDVPDTVAELDDDARVRLALAVVETACRMLQELVGDEVAPYEEIRTRVLEHGVDGPRRGGWRSAPGRRHRARHDACAARWQPRHLGRGRRPRRGRALTAQRGDPPRHRDP